MSGRDAQRARKWVEIIGIFLAKRDILYPLIRTRRLGRKAHRAWANLRRQA